MDSDRAFKNPFPDYSGTPLLGDDNKLNKTCQSSLVSVAHRLLGIIQENFVPDSKDYSIYTGSSGQAFLHLHLHNKLPGVRDDSHLKVALSWLDPCLSRLKGSRVSFLCGDAGPLALAAVVYFKLNDKKLCKYYTEKVESLWEAARHDREIPDEILFGRCGYLSALLFLKHNISQDCVRSEIIQEVVEAVLKSGENLARKTKSSIPLMYQWHDKTYLGAAHGLAGIFYMLLQIKEPALQARIHHLVRPCIDYMLTLRFASGNCPSSLGSESGDKLVHWCHGAPGWVHMFALAYKVFKDKQYLEAAKDCVEVVWKRGLLRKGYGICHGPAGNAYTFLAVFKLTGDQKYLYYAYKFAEWCCDYGKHGCRTPDRPYSMFEGMAGTVYFLVDLLDPKNSAFPAFEFQT
ncbi:unnamed protein product [Candidula unifasciata]|uniref:LanC-like protein 2 n=1 Tax=Candidula unifasciata TaxID=100452 RepID=A0A8S3ZY37_9EUPU|nr:unnamed protein product [Candidula unifasciata]